MSDTSQGTQSSELYLDVESKKPFGVDSGEETATMMSELSTDDNMTQSVRLRSPVDPDVARYLREMLRSSSSSEPVDEVMKRFHGKHENPPRNKPTSVHDRLYREGQYLAMKKAHVAKQKEEADKVVEPPKLQLATRSYTPVRRRGPETTHERLYRLGTQRKKEAISEEAMFHAYHAKHIQSSPKPAARDEKEMVSRLYRRSESFQKEGKKKREQIAKKLAPRDPTSSRSISVKRGQKIYERGLAFKANTQKKIEDTLNSPRESTFPKMRTQTPSRRECFFEARGDEDSVCSSRSRMSTQSRIVRRTRRSQTPVRGRSQTPSRNRERSQTPSRRLSSQPRYSSATPSKGATPKLPPRTFNITPHT